MDYTFSYDKDYNPTSKPDDIQIDFGVPTSMVKRAIARLLLDDVEKRTVNDNIILKIVNNLEKNGLTTFLYRHFYQELSAYFKFLAESCKDYC